MGWGLSVPAEMPESRRHYLRVCSVLAGSMYTLTGGWPSQLRMSGWRKLSRSQKGLQWKKVLTRFGGLVATSKEGGEGVWSPYFVVLLNEIWDLFSLHIFSSVCNPW